jgi:hypothetical protein
LEAAFDNSPAMGLSEPDHVAGKELRKELRGQKRTKGSGLDIISYYATLSNKRGGSGLDTPSVWIIFKLDADSKSN